MYQIKKRSGELELFELSKIKSAIKRTFDSCNRNYQESIIETISIKSVADAETKIKDNVLNVEDIQDSVEKVLMTYGYEDVAKAYILYRKQHERVRNAKETVLDYKKTVDSYLKADDWRVKENASIDYSLGGLILGNSGAITANYWLSEIYDEEIANAHRNCDIHIHDLSMLSAYCNGGSLKQLIKEGLGGVPKKISSKPASHLSTLCNQIVNFLGILSLEFAGAQALSSVDTLLAPFVKSDSLSYNEVKQCIQSLVFGLNTPSRWGGQPVFSNFTIDWTVPDDLAELNCIVGGKEVDFKYKDCKREMDMINKAFLEVMVDGDADGRSFSYPILTYSITKDFDWDTESINNKLLFEMTAKYGIPYFSNYINSDMNPSDTRSMCCRLRLDLRELRRKNGGYFGSGDGTGSIGVTTINMPRLAYLSKDEDDFYKRLDRLMDICSRSLEIKRDVVSKLLQDGLYPYTKIYVKNFNNHFSTIATHGMNEMCLNANWIKDNIASEKGYKFAKDVLDHMRNRLSDYQEKTGNLYNLESAPAESTCVVENDYIMTTKGNISVKSILNMSESERSELGIMSVNLEDKKLEVKHLKDIWKTRENAQCLKIYFDNGDSIIVTPNHKIAKRFTSGNKSSRLNWIDYVRADELKENDRLVALNKSSPLGDYVDYTVGLGTPCGKKLTFSEHNLFGEFYYGKKPEGYVFHHIDENKKNNTKSNLVMMSSTDHKRLHGKKDGYKYLPTGSGQDNNFYGKHHTEESRKKMGVRSDSENFESWYKNMCASCRSDEHRRKLSEIAKNKPSEKHSKYRHDCDTDKILELWYNGMTVSEISKTLGGNYTYSLVKSRLKISGITPNHKIVKIEKLEETFDVYDLEVEDNHNFFVSGCAEKMGVLVHNCLRFAMHDKKDFPDIITAGDKTEGAPYYTNSSNLPVGYTDDIFEALDHQDELQTRYTGGTVFHAFLGEKLPSWQAAMNLTRKIAENYKLPYFTFSPTYSICQEHGYLVGEQWKCPHCGKDTEVYSRVTGYYRAVQNFNDGKAHEFKDRKEYTNFSREFKSTQVQTTEQETEKVEDIKLERPILFTTSTCPNCKIVKQLLAEYDFVYDLVVADQDMETARKFDINQAPTLVVQDEEGNLIKIANVSNIKKFIEEAMADIEE